MKSPAIHIFLCLFLPTFLLAQNPPVETGNVPVSQAAGGGQYGGMFANLMNKRPLDIHGKIGSPYLFEDWAKVDLSVMGETVTFEKAKIDLLNNVLEVEVNGAEKVLDLHYVGEFVIEPANAEEMTFFNGTRLKYEEKKLTGFVKVMPVGDMSILRWYKARIVKPTQSSKITGGDPREKIVQSSTVFIMKGDKLYEIKKKSDLLDVMRRKEKKMKTYLKEHKFNLKDDAMLMAMLEHYQS